jgi:hypothetical protein
VKVSGFRSRTCAVKLKEEHTPHQSTCPSFFSSTISCCKMSLHVSDVCQFVCRLKFTGRSFWSSSRIPFHLLFLGAVSLICDSWLVVPVFPFVADLRSGCNPVPLAGSSHPMHGRGCVPTECALYRLSILAGPPGRL